MATNSGIDEGVVALNSSTPTLIVAADQRRKLLILENLDGSIVEHYGSSSVTTTSPTYSAGEKLKLNCLEGAQEAWYGISASGTPNVAYTEVWE